LLFIFLVSLAAAPLLASCAPPPGSLIPVAGSAPGASQIEMLVATTRARAAPGEMFSGMRGGPGLDFADIIVSIPPGSARQLGEVQRPRELPGNPATDFVTLKTNYNDRAQALATLHRLERMVPKKQVLVFVHGFNNRFDDAVFRFAQIVHDSDAEVVPILFTWPSKGSVLAYGYDHESASYSRDALEDGLRFLARSPGTGEITVLAHSMGNWVTLEALRQMAIRDGKVAEKIRNVILAAPDVDVDIAREQIAAMGARRPYFTLITSRDDRALALSRKIWGEPRLGSVDPAQEPYRTALESERINIINLTGVASPDQLHHATFAENPQVVKLLGRIESGQTLTDERIGAGERLMQMTAGAAASAGHMAGLAASAPIAIIDPVTREHFGDQAEALGGQLGALGQSIGDAVAPR